jgi:hypothetical protein
MAIPAHFSLLFSLLWYRAPQGIKKIYFNFVNPHFLKGLSHEIDFKNIDKMYSTELGITKGCGWFLNFSGASMILAQKVYFLRLMPVYVGLTMVSCLFLSVPSITSRV